MILAEIVASQYCSHTAQNLHGGRKTREPSVKISLHDATQPVCHPGLTRPRPKETPLNPKKGTRDMLQPPETSQRQVFFFSVSPFLRAIKRKGKRNFPLEVVVISC